MARRSEHSRTASKAATGSTPKGHQRPVSLRATANVFRPLRASGNTTDLSERPLASVTDLSGRPSASVTDLWERPSAPVASHAASVVLRRRHVVVIGAEQTLRVPDHVPAGQRRGGEGPSVVCRKRGEMVSLTAYGILPPFIFCQRPFVSGR